MLTDGLIVCTATQFCGSQDIGKGNPYYYISVHLSIPYQLALFITLVEWKCTWPGLLLHCSHLSDWDAGRSLVQRPLPSIPISSLV